MVWQHATWGRKANNFKKMINSCLPTIKFTAEYPLDKVNILDVKAIRCGNKLLADLYIKPTNTHQYLGFSSSHV